MKILYLHQYFNTPSMSGGTRSYEMAQRLVSAGHEVHMVTTDCDINHNAFSGWKQTSEDGIHVHWLNIPYSNKIGYRERIKAFFRFAYSAGPKAASLKGDIIYATSTPLTIALPAVYAARRCRVPMVFEVRDLWPEIPIAVGALKNPLAIMAARRLERFSYNNASHIVALSPGMKEGVISTGYPENLVSIIPNGCDIDFFNAGTTQRKDLRNKYDWLQNRPLVIYTGALGLINGVDYMVRLAAEVMKSDPEIRFLVIGSGREEEKIINEAKRLCVHHQNFFVMSQVPKYKIPAWLSAADIATSFVIDKKELWANSANKFFDALAAGKPIAINYNGWQADLIEETGAGLLLDARNIDKASADLLRIIRDGKWLRKAGESAHMLAKDMFDRNKLAKKLEQIFIDQLARSKDGMMTYQND